MKAPGDAKVPDDWRSIKTAPKKGWFWLWIGWRGACIGRRSLDPTYRWEFIEHAKIDRSHAPVFVNAITSGASHWAPLPGPPPDNDRGASGGKKK